MSQLGNYNLGLSRSESQPRYSLGNFQLRLNRPEPFLDYNPTLKPIFPPAYLQFDLIKSLNQTSPAPDGTIRLRPGFEISGETMTALANFLAGYASNAPKPPIDGWALSTDHINKGARIVGLNTQLPSGISLVYNKDTNLVGFLFEGQF